MTEVWFDPIIDLIYDYLDILDEVEEESGTTVGLAKKKRK